MNNKDNLEKNTRTNWVLTLISRMTGLLRDGALSRIFGTGILASSFYFAFLIPNLFRRLFGEGALAAAFLPSYSKLHHEDPATARAFASLTISKLVVLLGALTLIGEIALYAITSFQEEPSPALELTMVMLPYMPLVCCVAIFAAMLHVHDRFGIPAAAPIILNGCMIVVAVALLGVFENPLHSMFAIGASILIAGVIQVAWSLHALRRYGWFTKETEPGKSEFKAMKHRMIPMVIGLGTLQLNTLFDGLIASWPNLFGDTIFGLQYPLGEGAMGSLTWAQRLYQFPLGVFGIAVATAIYPLLAKQSNDPRSFASTIQRGLRLVVFIGFPASAGLIMVRNPLAATVFQGVNFTSEDAMIVGSVLLGYAPAVWAYSMTQVLTKGFYAKDDTKTPVKVAVACMVFNAILNITLIWTPLNIAGLAWSTAICAVLQVSILLFYFRKHVPIIATPEVVSSWISTALLTLFMSAGVSGVVISMWQPKSDWSHAIVVLLVAIVTGIAIFGFGSAMLRKPELRWILGRQQ